MTQASIDRQIEAIRATTAKASVSKEAAIAFLKLIDEARGPKKNTDEDSQIANKRVK